MHFQFLLTAVLRRQTTNYAAEVMKNLEYEESTTDNAVLPTPSVLVLLYFTKIGFQRKPYRKCAHFAEFIFCCQLLSCFHHPFMSAFRGMVHAHGAGCYPFAPTSSNIYISQSTHVCTHLWHRSLIVQQSFESTINRKLWMVEE